MYHVISNAELKFNSLAEALNWAETRPRIYPYIPQTAMDEEDQTTPRICVAPSIEDCLTAIGVTGTFRRCCAGNDSAKSYENDNEAYPILILEFPDNLDYFSPSKKQVPDIKATHEKWLLHPVRPERVTLRWLGAYSVEYDDEDEDAIRTICTGITFLDDPGSGKGFGGYDHPWLNGKGHPLESSGMGGDPWPDITPALNQLYLSQANGGQLGFQMPIWPPDGRVKFRPIMPAPTPKTGFRESGTAVKEQILFPRWLKRFSGLWDCEDKPAFENDFIAITHDGKRATGCLDYYNGQWIVNHLPEPIVLTRDSDFTILSKCPPAIQAILRPYMPERKSEVTTDGEDMP